MFPRYLNHFYNLLVVNSLKFIYLFLNKSVPKSIRDASKKPLLSHSSGETTFYFFVFYFMQIQLRIAAIIFVYRQLLLQRSIAKFFNNCLKLARNHQLRLDFGAFEIKFIKVFIAGYATLVTSYTVQLFVFFDFDWQGLVSFVLYQFQGIIIFTYFNFISFCLYFLQFLFENISFKLKKNCLKGFNTSFHEISELFLATDQLLCEFNKTFGFLLSAMTFFATTTLTGKVEVWWRFSWYRFLISIKVFHSRGFISGGLRYRLESPTYEFGHVHSFDVLPECVST